VFGVNLLSKIKPDDIVQWMQLKAYGGKNLSPDVQLLKGIAKSLLGQYKKALSYFL
jgi:hypothetical protein